MANEPYTFEDMRASLVRQRNRSSLTRTRPVFNDPELLDTVLDRMIALIDAMTSDERKLSNVLTFAPERQQELASITGTSLRAVQGLMAARKSLELTRHIYPSDS